MFPPDVPTKSSYSKKAYDLPNYGDHYEPPQPYVGSGGGRGSEGPGAPRSGGGSGAGLGLLGALLLIGLLSSSGGEGGSSNKGEDKNKPEGLYSSGKPLPRAAKRAAAPTNSGWPLETFVLVFAAVLAVGGIALAFCCACANDPQEAPTQLHQKPAVKR